MTAVMGDDAEMHGLIKPEMTADTIVFSREPYNLRYDGQGE